MTQKEKELLLRDLSARLRYGVKVDLFGQSKELIGVLDDIISVGYDINDYEDAPIEDIKPYLRPMSSMTEEEKEDYNSKFEGRDFSWEIYYGSTDWLNAHHFDYRGLIEEGLALEALENMYK